MSKRKIKLEDDKEKEPKEAYEVLVIDRSGSMSYQKDEVIKGINDYVAGLQKAAADCKVNTQLAVFIFDTTVTRLFDFTPVAEFAPFTNETYVPQGLTALNDATMDALDLVRERLKGREAAKNVDVTISIYTDGFENASKKYPNVNGQCAEIKGLIKEVTDTYKWTVSFIGAGSKEAVQAQAVSMNIPIGNVTAYRAGGQGATTSWGNMEDARSMKMMAFASGAEKSATSYFVQPTVAEDNSADVVATPTITTASNTAELRAAIDRAVKEKTAELSK